MIRSVRSSRRRHSPTWVAGRQYSPERRRALRARRLSDTRHIRAERIGLLPRQADAGTGTLRPSSQKVSDGLVSVIWIWRSRGRSDQRGQNTESCRTEPCHRRWRAGGRGEKRPTVIREADNTAARIAVADASFQTEDFATAARRSRDLYEDTNDAAILVKEVISMLQAGDLDAGFERDEVLQNRLEEVADADLLERYEDAMSKAVNAYLSAAP